MTRREKYGILWCMSDENAPDPVLVKVGELITIARTSRIDSPSIPELAKTIGIDAKTLRNIENGQSWPQDKTRRLIESSLQLRHGWLTDAREAITAGLSVPTAVPATFIQSLGTFYTPYLGPSDTEVGWSVVTMRMRTYCNNIAAFSTAITSANASPPSSVVPSLTQPVGAGFPYWPWQPEINYLNAPPSRQEPSHTHDSRIDAARQQISDKHDKTAAQIMQALRAASELEISIVNTIANENHSRIDYVSTELRNTLADMAALAASAPEPLTKKLAALVAHARTAVDVLTGDKPQPLVRPLTTRERMDLADRLADMCRTALGKRGQEISRGDAYNAAIGATRDVKVVDRGTFDDLEVPTDVVGEILANPEAHGIDIDRTVDLWSAHYNPQPRSAAETTTGPAPSQFSAIIGPSGADTLEPIATMPLPSDCHQYPPTEQ